MIVSDAFRGKHYAVLGLARSGLATVRALVASGADVTAWDSREDARAAVMKAPPLQGRGWGGACPPESELTAPTPSPSPEGEGSLSIADPLTIDLTGFDGVIVSPGVPINRHPIADAAHAAHVPLLGDIELFAQARAGLPAHKVVGITGTNGKSTTTALIHHILTSAGVPAMLGGNIGLPILGQEPLAAGGVYVLELSSYQIDLTHGLDCDVAILTNITPDHLDRYIDFADYASAKERLFTMQHTDKVAVIACDDNPSRMIVSRINHRLHRVHAADITDQSRWPSLQGPHNAQNVACAVAACTALGLDAAQIEAGLASYPGLSHRMERIRELDGVLWVNDSKATNATSSAPALAAYPVVHWILGGQAKTDDLDACAPHYGHVKAAYVIGDAADLFERLLSPHMPVTNAGTLAVAVAAARAAAAAGETVLLSPACASFDQFRDFEARGDAFRALVEKLA